MQVSIKLVFKYYNNRDSKVRKFARFLKPLSSIIELNSYEVIFWNIKKPTIKKSGKRKKGL